MSAVSITLRGEDYDVTVPSGAQTGLELEPFDGEPFEIEENKRTGGRIVLRPFESLIRNQGQGFKFKPTLDLEHVTIAQLSGGIMLDQIAVRYKDSTSQAEIDQQIANKGTSVISVSYPSKYYLLQLPASLSLEQALEDFNNSDLVSFALPNTMLTFFQNDEEFRYQYAWEIVGLKDAYPPEPIGLGYTGTYAPVVAVVDSGVFYDHPALAMNIWINEGELPEEWTNDDDNDSIVNIDFDRDGFVTFYDLNMPATVLTPDQQALMTDWGLTPRPDDNAPLITPTDLLDSNVPDNGDNDNPDGHHSYPDDLIGWSFQEGTNRPEPYFNYHHGTSVAGIIGAQGNNGELVTGVAWKVRILPVAVKGIFAESLESPDATEIQRKALRDGPLRHATYKAIEYAALVGADIINLSAGGVFLRGGTDEDPDPACMSSEMKPAAAKVLSIGDEPFIKLKDGLDKELDSPRHKVEGSLLVTAGPNCNYDIDDLDNLYLWPSVRSWPSKIDVTSTSVYDPEEDTSGTRSDHHVGNRGGHAAYGRRIEIAAPGQRFIMLDHEGTRYNRLCNAINISDMGMEGNICGGTSDAAPMVSGVAALVLSYFEMQSPCELADRILLNANEIDYLDPRTGCASEVAGGGICYPVGDYGYRLNAYRALANPAGVGHRSGP